MKNKSKEQIVFKIKKPALAYLARILQTSPLLIIGLIFYFKFGEFLDKLRPSDTPIEQAEFYEPRIFMPKIFGTTMIVIGALLVLSAILNLLAVRLTLTPTRVSGSYGIVKKTVLEVPIGKVESIQEKKTMWGTVFRYSYVEIKSRATTYQFRYVANAPEFMRAFYSVSQQQKEKDDSLEIQNILEATYGGETNEE